MNKQKFLYKTIPWICVWAILLSGCSALPLESNSAKTASLSASPIQKSSESQPDAENERESSIQGEEWDAASVIQDESAYTVYELTFERDGMRIYGNLYLPKRESEQYPTAIIGHGFGSSYSYMAPYAAILAENGIASYVFDFCGGSSSSRSDGDTLQMSVLTEREDMKAVLEGIRAYHFVDRENMFLIGESQGGLVAALLAASRPENIRGLALLYPALVIPDDARERYADVSDVPETAQVFGTPVGRGYFTDVLQMDVYDEIGSFDRNVLIVHGSDDSIVPLSYSKRAAEIYPSAELIVMDGAGHGFHGADRENAAIHR